MSLLDSGYLQDGFKAFVYFVPLVYVVHKRSALKYFWFLFTGLLLLFLGHCLDFCDEFPAIKNVFIVGKKYPYHDMFEDVVGFTLGFALFIVGIFLEFVHSKKSNKDSLYS